MSENFHLGTKMLNEILDKCKTHGDKRGLGYINKDETPTNREIMLVKGKDETPNLVESPKKNHYAHIVRKLDTLNLYAILGS